MRARGVGCSVLGDGATVVADDATVYEPDVTVQCGKPIDLDAVSVPHASSRPSKPVGPLPGQTKVEAAFDCPFVTM